jgi:ATP-dependent Clp protease protease subunit
MMRRLAVHKDSHDRESDGTTYIIFCTTIEDNTAQEFMDIIANDLPEDTHTLYILFSTGGGSVSYGFTIYNFLRALPYRIIMHNIGSVDSIGVVIFLAAHERYSTDNGSFLIHRVKGSSKNEKTDDSSLREKLSCIEVEEEKIKNVVTRYTKISTREFWHLFDIGQLKDVDYAFDRGIIDDVRDARIPQGAKVLVIKATGSPGE